MSNKKISQFTQVQQTDPNTTEIPLIQGNPFQNVTISINDLVQDLKDNYGIAVGGLQGEISERISADISLSTQISTETSERVSADTSLSTSISTETSERVSADTSITNLISTETSQRISSDASLSAAIAGFSGSLEGLGDVGITDVQNGDVIKYNATTSLWENVATTDILTNVANGELLYNNEGVISGMTLNSVISGETSQRISTDQSLSTAIANISGGGEEVEITKEFVLGNDSDAGDLMMLNDNDGKVYSPELYADKTFSTATTQYYTGTTYSDDGFKKINNVISDDGSKVAFYYWDNGLNLVLKIGIINEDLSITYGESQIIEIPSQLSEYGNPQGVVFLPNNNNKLLVGYTAPYTYSFCIRVITLDGISITNIGSKNVISTSTGCGYGDIIFDPFNEGNFMVYITGPSRFGLKYMNIDNNNNLSIISTFDYNNGFVHINQDSRFIFDPLVKNRFIISGSNGSGWDNHRIFVFNMLSNAYLYTLSEAPFSYAVCSVDFDPFTKNKIIYSYNSYDVLYMRVATIGIDSKITFGDQNTIATNINSINPRSYYSKNIKNEIISLVSDSTLQYTKLIVSSVSGSTVSFVNSYDVRSEQTQLYLYPSFCKNKPNLVLFSCTNTSNTNIYAVATQLPFTNLYNFNYNDTIGFLTETGLEGETKKVRFLGGIDYNKSGLTLGEKYYVQQDGSVSNISSAYEYGKAISTTEIKTNSKNEIDLTKGIDSLNDSDVNIIGYVDSSINNVLVDVNTALSSIPTGYEISYLGFTLEYSSEKTNIYGLHRVTPVYANMYVVGNGNDIYLNTYFPNSSTLIINGMFLKKIMTYGKYVLIHAINYGDNNNSEFNILGVERNHTFLLDLSTGNVTGIRPSELTFFNYTDKIAYTRDLGGLHHIYDLKTQTETQITPPNGSSIIYPKSNTHCYMMYGTTIGYYAYSNLSTPIWSQTMPGSYTAADFTHQLDFSAEYDLIFGAYSWSIFVYPILANLAPRQLGFFMGNLQLSKDILSLRSDGLSLWETKTLNYIGKIKGDIYPWLVSSNEDGLYTLYNNKAAKFYI